MRSSLEYEILSESCTNKPIDRTEKLSGVDEKDQQSFGSRETVYE